MTEAASAVLVERTISDCAGVTGGGLYANDQGNVTLKGGSRVERCTSPRGGGVMAFNVNVALLEGSIIGDCQAGNFAGGMRLQPVAHSCHACALLCPVPRLSRLRESRILGLARVTVPFALGIRGEASPQSAQ